QRNDHYALAAALARNVRPDAGAWPQASQLALYAADASRQLTEQLTESIVSGTVAFPVANSERRRAE
ncbi:MAG: ubiquinol-cytochrome C chaperone, partial [Mesorhizobium sp.]